MSILYNKARWFTGSVLQYGEKKVLEEFAKEEI
jgi:hypothetical protein